MRQIVLDKPRDGEPPAKAERPYTIYKTKCGCVMRVYDNRSVLPSLLFCHLHRKASAIILAAKDALALLEFTEPENAITHQLRDALDASEGLKP